MKAIANKEMVECRLYWIWVKVVVDMAMDSADDNGDSLFNATAVAIDKDKNSQHAFRWAVDNFARSNPVIVLIHVKHKNHQYSRYPLLFSHSVNEFEKLLMVIRLTRQRRCSSFSLPPVEYCARKGVRLKQVALDHIDVAQAVADYINSSLIGNIVLRDSKTKMFPTSLMKIAPDFCSVYGRSSLPKKQNECLLLVHRKRHHLCQQFSSRSQQDNAELDSDGVRQGRESVEVQNQVDFLRTRSMISLENHNMREGGRFISNFSMESTDPPFSAGRLSTFRYSTSDASQNTGTFALAIMDSSAQGLDVSVASASSLNESNADFLEAEMRRLRLELKQTMAMYGTACKEALSAKKKATELNQWKVDEVRKFEETKLAGEAALAMAEMEKAKCRVAIEAAEKSQKLAEMEAWKRKQAEMKAERETGEKNHMLDQTVSDWPVEEALRFAILALKCAELRKRDRPSLATVIVPELNRLRDLGMNSEQQQSRGVSSRGRSCSPLRHPTSTSQAWMSNATQEKARTSCRGRTEQGSNQGDADGQES
ncbi:hypothetical protein NC652_017594 [Populus alba x Populus x berolinensis]|nr:hypothetical protein NC652_017594 [Populus alba x Populus x berolinensis]